MMTERHRGVAIPDIDSMTIERFIETFHEILDWKNSEGRRAYYDNPHRERCVRRPNSTVSHTRTAASAGHAISGRAAKPTQR